MCGIVAVLARPSLRPPPEPGAVDATFDLALEELSSLGGPIAGPVGPSTDAGPQLAALRTATGAMRALDASLRGVPGLTCLLGSPVAVEALERGRPGWGRWPLGWKSPSTAGQFKVGTAELEELNAALVKFRDVVWALGRDRLEALRSISALAVSLGLANDRAPSSPGRPRCPVGRPRRPPVARPSRGTGPRLGRPAPHADRPRPRPRVGRR